jgi:1,4-dihydroxy-2-naphthoate octaprenyltransferase
MKARHVVLELVTLLAVFGVTFFALNLLKPHGLWMTLVALVAALLAEEAVRYLLRGDGHERF